MSGDKVKTITAYKKEGKLASLKSLIYFDAVSKEDLAAAEEAELATLEYSAFVEEGLKIDDADANYTAAKNVGPDTVYTISYTSGTTGVPKGVMLTQRNLCANVGSYSTHDPSPNASLRAGEDVYISYLPLAHVFERFMYVLCFFKGVQIGFF